MSDDNRGGGERRQWVIFSPEAWRKLKALHFTDRRRVWELLALFDHRDTRSAYQMTDGFELTDPVSVGDCMCLDVDVLDTLFLITDIFWREYA